jgi:hypothetical protein
MVTWTLLQGLPRWVSRVAEAAGVDVNLQFSKLLDAVWLFMFMHKYLQLFEGSKRDAPA